MTNFARIAAALALIIASPMACANKTAGEHVDDSWIHTKVKSKLAFHRGLSINIEVYNGIVQLAGFTGDADLRQSIPAEAASVTGVRKVINQIYLVEPGRSAGTRLDDGTTTTKVKATLTDAGFPSINVEVYDGQVLLSGFVDSTEARDQAIAAIGDLSGINKVINGMDLKPAD